MIIVENSVLIFEAGVYDVSRLRISIIWEN
jgi:hypothetical protein